MEEKFGLDADNAKKLTSNAKEKIAKENAEKYKKEQKEYEKLRARMKEYAKVLCSGEVKNAIQKASSLGESSMSYLIVNYEKQISNRNYCLADELRVLLVALGYRVEIGKQKQEPYGSDPLLPYTTYSLYLNISWD